MIQSSFFDAIQKTCLPGIWSQGVALSRADAVSEDSIQKDEIRLRVRVADRPISYKVTLWPEDEDWFCDCNGRFEVCAHVAAAVIGLKSGKIKSKFDNDAGSSPSSSKIAQIHYRFKRNAGGLLFERILVRPEGSEERLSDTLVSLMGGISSGRIRSLPLSPTQDDYGVDSVVGKRKLSALNHDEVLTLFKFLSGCSNISLDGTPVAVASKPLPNRARLVEEGSGFRLELVKDSEISEAFQGGIVLTGQTLKAREGSLLNSEERKILIGKGTYFPLQETAKLVSEIIPTLQKNIQIEILSDKLPVAIRVPPQIVLQMEKVGETETLSILPRIIYGDGESLPSKDRSEVIIPDPAAEKFLVRKLQNELQLTPGQTVKLEGEAAVDFCLRLKDWKLSGTGAQAFSVESTLIPELAASEKGVKLSFRTGSSGQGADPGRVLKAWRQHQNYVPLLSGGWAPLPKDWLERYGRRILSILAVQDSAPSLPAYLLPELAELCEDTGQPYPDSLKELRNLLAHVEGIQEEKLPQDLQATLREYQRKGVNWLCFLRNLKMGALLADDMGLGKTLQALCSIQGRTLVVAPTSVLQSWSQQIKQFRPGLSLSVYYGNQRKIDKSSDVTLTSYALLRQDQEVLVQENWKAIILDEAQVIKNPDSQVARAAHRLRADFRIALSGTPVENRLDDLWSQFQFLNPGLLGTLEGFQDQFAQPISRGNEEITRRLRDRIRPFILRRMKNEVAPELPPRTETVLYCELDEEEREVYESILASAREEVVEKLEAGGSVFAALELLLRMRQACCHVSLVPGQKSNRSSKIDLLIQTLQNSIAMGHRALIFSQWTSFLDLIEPHLNSNGITFVRLDGTTKDREEVVNRFQTDSRVQVMLLSLKAGGVGLTLTAADHIFLMDPWWNPSVEDQAADRAHRIGQVNPVLIQRLVAQDTIEDRILNLQKTKSQLAAAVLQDAAAATSITRDDLLALLS